MATTIKLSSEIVEQARRYAQVYQRSTAKQIEFWARVGKIAEENPDLSYAFIKELLLGMEEASEGHLDEYEFSKN